MIEGRISGGGEAMYQAELLRLYAKGRRNFHGEELRQADLRGAHLAAIDLTDANLAGCDLSDANLVGAKLGRANLFQANLSRADLRNSCFRWAELSKAILVRADLKWAQLANSSLRQANLAGAQLQNASLVDANLVGASFRWADLTGAALDGAEVEGADFGESYGAGFWEALLQQTPAPPPSTESSPIIERSAVRLPRNEPWDDIANRLAVYALTAGGMLLFLGGAYVWRAEASLDADFADVARVAVLCGVSIYVSTAAGFCLSARLKRLDRTARRPRRRRR